MNAKRDTFSSGCRFRSASSEKRPNAPTRVSVAWICGCPGSARDARKAQQSATAVQRREIGARRTTLSEACCAAEQLRWQTATGPRLAGRCARTRASVHRGQPWRRRHVHARNGPYAWHGQAAMPAPHSERRRSGPPSQSRPAAMPSRRHRVHQAAASLPVLR